LSIDENKKQKQRSLSLFQIIMSDEIAKAQTAKPTEDTIFGKIARKEIKVELLHDDDQV
jgi:hypothetical protein